MRLPVADVVHRRIAAAGRSSQVSSICSSQRLPPRSLVSSLASARTVRYAVIAPSINARDLIAWRLPGITSRFRTFLQAGGASRATWGDEPIALALQMSDSQDERGGEDGALRDVRERCDGRERRSALDRSRRCQEATHVEAAKAAPGAESAPKALARRPGRVRGGRFRVRQAHAWRRPFRGNDEPGGRSRWWKRTCTPARG